MGKKATARGPRLGALYASVNEFFAILDTKTAAPQSGLAGLPVWLAWAEQVLVSLGVDSQGAVRLS